MGFLDDFAKNADLGNLAGQLLNNPQVQQAVASLLSDQPGSVGGSGGMQQVMAALQSGGLGEQLSSWLSQGSNQPVSGRQVQQALGDDVLAQFAGKAGVDPAQAGSVLAGVLPGLIDRLSPDGKASGQPSLESLLGAFG